MVLLKTLLITKPDLLIIYKENLIKNFVNADPVTKTRSLEIISECTSGSTFQEIGDEMLGYMEENTDSDMKSLIGNTLIFVSQKNDYSNINDFEWLVRMIHVIMNNCTIGLEITVADIWSVYLYIYIYIYNYLFRVRILFKE